MRTLFTVPVFLLLAAVLFPGCNEDQPASTTAEPFIKGDVVVEVEQMLNAYQKAVRDEGLLAEFRYLDQSDDFFWIPPGYDRALSYVQVADILNMNAKRYKWIDNAWVKLAVFPQSKKLATYFGLVSSAMLDTSDQVYRYRLVESGTVIKRDAGWKILCGQTSIVEEEISGSKE